MEKMHFRQVQQKLVKISQFDVASLHLIPSPLLACDLGLPEILINVSCFPTLTCRSPVLTLTISMGRVPRIYSSWAETYFPMFNNSTTPQTHTVPQTSLHFWRVSQTTNAPQISKRQNSIQSVSTPPKVPLQTWIWSRIISDFILVDPVLIFSSIGTYPSRCWWNPPGFCPNFQQFLAPSADYWGLVAQVSANYSK